jgi:hypothetical protein
METEKNLAKERNSVYKYILGAAIGAAGLLLIPLVALQFDGVNWDLFDFFAAWVMLFSAGSAFLLIARQVRNLSYRLAVGLAVFTGLFMIWSNLAVGLIGSENNPANLMYFGVLAVGILGAFITRFKPQGMAVSSFATALAVVIVALIALIGDMGGTPMEILMVNGFFAALWTGSGFLFLYSAQRTYNLNKVDNQNG